MKLRRCSIDKFVCAESLVASVEAADMTRGAGGSAIW
jgi:hypothetical protein